MPTTRLPERTEYSIHSTAWWHDNQANRKQKKGLTDEAARHRRIAQALRDELKGM